MQLNDLYDYDYKIYQDSDLFKFSLDSILLSEFVSVSKESKIVDFCTGNMAVLLVLKAKGYNHLSGIELQEEPFKLSKKTLEYNKILDIKIINDSIENIAKYYKVESIDAVTCNPPFFKNTSKKNQNENVIKRIARHEITCNLDMIFKSAKYVLKSNGTLFLVHRSERTDDIIITANKYGFAVKDISFVYTKNNKESNIVLLRIIKNGNLGVKVNKPLMLSRDLTSYKNIFKEDEK